MVETSENVKITMEATCSQEVDTNSNDNISGDGESTLAKESKGNEKSSTNILKIKQDESKLNSKEESNENGKPDSDEHNSKDNGLEKSASESVSNKSSSESPEKSDKCNNDVSIVNGEETKDKGKSAEVTDTCESNCQEQDFIPSQKTGKTAINDESEVEGTETCDSKDKAITENAEDKSEKEGDDVQSEQVEKPSEDKSESINYSNAPNDPPDKKVKSSIGRKRGPPEENCDVPDDSKDGEDEPMDTSKEDTPKTVTKKRAAKTKQLPKTAILNETGRSTRSSINPDFAAKQRNFLNKVQNAYSSIKLLEAASSMSESEGDEDLSDSSYSDDSHRERLTRPLPSKAYSPNPTSSPAEKKVVALPPGLAEKLAEKSRALLTEKKLSFPFTIGDKKLAPFPGSTEKTLVASPMNVADKKALSNQLANGMKRKKETTDVLSPVRTLFPGTKTVHELDEEQTLLVPSSSKIEVPISRKRKASSSAETMDLDSEDCASPATKTTGAAMTNKKAKLVRVDETGKESQISCDVYCWFCHREGAAVMCKTCPRVYHVRCLVQPPPEHFRGKWVCPLCVTILKAESTDNRSKAMKMLTLDQFCLLLSFTVARMKSYTGSEAFCKPVDPKEFPMYSFYIVYPMDISQLERNIKNRLYGSTEAFLADASWILHNCAIFNSLNNKLTHMAKQVLKICRQEIADIENCPDCYFHAHSGNEEWFLEVCRRPHLLVLAKLKGFPFWPAKATQCSPDGMVDVRFFGAHDRAWVPAKECVLYSRSSPQPKKKKKSTLDSCIEELEKHITKLEACFGEYVPADGRVRLDPKKIDEQLRAALPSYKYGEAMRMPIAFSNEALVKACEENLKAASTAYVEPAAATIREGEEVTDEDGDVTHSDSLQSDKEETPTTGRPKKKAKLSTPRATTSKTGGSKIIRPRRETRKSGIVDRLTEKLALLDDDHSKTPPPDIRSEEPMDTDVPPTLTEPPGSEPTALADSTHESDKPPEAESVPVKIEPVPGAAENSKEVETEAQKLRPGSVEKEIPPVDEIKQEREDTTEEGLAAAAPSAAATAFNATSVISNRLERASKDKESSSKEQENSSRDEEPVRTRRSTTRAAATAATAATAALVAVKPKVASATPKTTPKSKGKASTPAAKGKAAKGGVSPKKKGQTDESSPAKHDTPRKAMACSTPIGVVVSSPQEKFTARKSVPGGNNPKNISLIKSSSLPPSMSASPTILSSAVRVQTSAPSQQSVQVISSPGMPSLTVAPMARNASLLNSSVKTSSVTTITSGANLVSSSLGSGGSVILSGALGTTPTSISSVSIVSSTAASTGETAPTNMPALSSAPTSAKSTVTTSSPLTSASAAPSYPPSIAGPHSAGVRSYAGRLTELFCGMIEDTLKDIGGKGNASATIKALQLEFERLNWQHTQEMAELRHNTTLVVEEIKKTFETEKILAVKDAVAARTTLSLKEKEAAIIATKRKQWCAFCLKEALFYCCWNTSYCDYSCQQKHWPVHSMYCTQNENCDDPSSPSICGVGAPKPLIIKTPNSANGGSATVNSATGAVTVSGTLMPVISARSSVSISGNSTTPTYVLATTIPSTSTSGSTIFVPAGSRPGGTATNVSNARPYVLPQNVRIRPSAPGQKVVLRQSGKPTTSPGQPNQVVFVVNNQKK